MDRGAWPATPHEVSKVRHDWATGPHGKEKICKQTKHPPLREWLNKPKYIPIIDSSVAEASQRYMHPIYIVALFTVAKTWKQPKYLLMNKWIKKMWYIYAMEYDSAIKKEKILPVATTQMDLEGIMLCQMNQTEKDIYLWYHLYLEYKKQTTKTSSSCTENRLAVVRGRGQVGKMNERDKKI